MGYDKNDCWMTCGEREQRLADLKLDIWEIGDPFEEVARMRGEIIKARELLVAANDALVEADAQIEYLHDKFKPTGSGMNAIAKIDMATTAIRHYLDALELSGVSSSEVSDDR